jgi:hypothetical protein
MKLNGSKFPKGKLQADGKKQQCNAQFGHVKNGP